VRSDVYTEHVVRTREELGQKITQKKFGELRAKVSMTEEITGCPQRFRTLEIEIALDILTPAALTNQSTHIAMQIFFRM